jgi:hypothetical protein
LLKIFEAFGRVQKSKVEISELNFHIYSLFKTSRTKFLLSIQSIADKVFFSTLNNLSHLSKTEHLLFLMIAKLLKKVRKELVKTEIVKQF